MKILCKDCRWYEAPYCKHEAARRKEELDYDPIEGTPTPNNVFFLARTMRANYPKLTADIHCGPTAIHWEARSGLPTTSTGEGSLIDSLIGPSSTSGQAGVSL